METTIEYLKNKIIDLEKELIKDELEIKHLEKMLIGYKEVCKKKDETIDFFIKRVKF
tara:strand:+ start:629 stop:799 length:171 start_codon:yes stop_codon:yes gene_type:complete